jgi:hypothetical protein
MIRFTGTALRVRVHVAVEIGVELFSIDARPPSQGAQEFADRYGLALGGLARHEVSDRRAVAGDDEALAVLHGAHDGGVVVAELSLIDDPDHPTILATKCYRRYKLSKYAPPAAMVNGWTLAAAPCKTVRDRLVAEAGGYLR